MAYLSCVSYQLPFNGKQCFFLNLLLQLKLQLTNKVIALRFDFVLPSEQFPAQLAALAFEFALTLLVRQLLCGPLMPHWVRRSQGYRCIGPVLN